MDEMSPYSTPISWSAWVAGPVNGEDVASWRNTSRNSLSSGVRIVISRPPILCVLVCVCLPDFLRSPVARVLYSGSARRRITLQRPACGNGLSRGPLRCLVRVPSHQRDCRRRRPDLSLLKSDWQPTQWAVDCSQPFIKRWSFGLVPLDVPVLHIPMAVRAFFVGWHRHCCLGRSLASGLHYSRPAGGRKREHNDKSPVRFRLVEKPTAWLWSSAQ